MLVWLLQTGEPTPAPGRDGKHFRTRMLASALAADERARAPLSARNVAAAPDGAWS